MGVECLGYKLLFRWEPSIASRGKMMGQTFELARKDPDQVGEKRSPELSLICPLKDPLIQGMDSASTTYLFYCELILCGC